MAEFKTEVVRIEDVYPHENADRLDVVKIYDYECITSRGRCKKGDLVAYIQEGSLLSQALMEEMEIKKPRIKAIKLRGQFSQGLVYPAREGWVEGQDVSEELGIEKYEPKEFGRKIAGGMYMFGKRTRGNEPTINYDIENIKKYRSVMEGEEIVITEKLHGTWFCLGTFPDREDLVSSKGLSKRNVAIEEDSGNLYWSIANKVPRIRREIPIYVLGEILGGGVQDLSYGLEEPILRVFDIYEGLPGEGRYLDWEDVVETCEHFGYDLVPELYRGPFDMDKILELTDGMDNITGSHMREGVVVKPVKEKWDNRCGRVILKSVSQDYLLRKGGTEFS